ncbi:biopolymer transporter ExbD [Akkermansiaceae bacterium]|nr:biopolymer transporter ExbD [Akkermansiaceae bacterium]
MKFNTKEPDVTVFPLAPMIDVVFLLLIFFIATMQFTDDERVLDISLPSSEEGADAKQTAGAIILNVREGGSFVVNKTEMTKDELYDKLNRIAAANPNQSIHVRCDGGADHQSFVEAVAVCEKAGIFNVFMGIESAKKSR